MKLLFNLARSGRMPSGHPGHCKICPFCAASCPQCIQILNDSDELAP